MKKTIPPVRSELTAARPIRLRICTLLIYNTCTSLRISFANVIILIREFSRRECRGTKERVFPQIPLEIGSFGSFQ
jgi:hypothetical protein